MLYTDESYIDGETMVTFEVQDDMLILNVEGWDRLWALKSRMEIPIENIRDVYTNPAMTLGWWQGIRAPGTHIPGVIVAGTFYKDGKRIFWDVKNAKKTIVIDLNDERYNQLIVEVEHPMQVVQQIQGQMR